MKIITKLTMAYIVSILLPITITLYFLIAVSTQTVIDQTIENTTQTTSQLKMNVINQLNLYIDITNKLCYNETIQKLLSLKEASMVNQNIKLYNDKKDEILNSILFYNYKLHAKIYTINDNILQDYVFFVNFDRQSDSYRAYEKLTAEQKACEWKFSNGKIYILRPISNYLKQPLGMTELMFPESELYTQISKLDPVEQKIIIYDKNGLVISSNDRLIVGTSIADKEYFRTEKIDKKIYDYTDNGSFKLIYDNLFDSRELPDWNIITFIPLDKIHYKADGLTKLGMLFMLLTFVISSIIFFSIEKSISKRINMLADNMDSIGEGKFNTIEDHGILDEIGIAIKKFNSMATSLDQLIYDNYVSQLKIRDIAIEKKKAELYALESQMQPHFLFNTLESIRMKLQIGDTKRAQDMLIALSKILRRSLSRSDDLITIREEIDFTLDYIKIQTYRFGEKIKCEIEKDADLGQCLIPKYTLQTLVENSIIHGFKEFFENRKIVIKILRENDIIQISVFDNGLGISNEKLEQIKTNLLQPLGENSTANIGIKNISDRIKMHFGNEYGLNIESMQKYGTTISFYIPYSTHFKEGVNVK